MKELCPDQGAPGQSDFRALCAELADVLAQYVNLPDDPEAVALLRHARAALSQPVPPSLKEQALEILNLGHEGWGLANDDWQTLRRALEALPE